MCGALERPRRVLGLRGLRGARRRRTKKAATRRWKCRVSPARPRFRPARSTRVRCCQMATWSAGATGATGSSATAANESSDHAGGSPGPHGRDAEFRPDGDHTCAVLSGGHVECWGYGGDGQLGDGSYESSDTPVEVQGLTSATQSCGRLGSHLCGAVRWPRRMLGLRGRRGARRRRRRKQRHTGAGEGRRPTPSRSRPGDTTPAPCCRAAMSTAGVTTVTAASGAAALGTNCRPKSSASPSRNLPGSKPVRPKK